MSEPRYETVAGISKMLGRSQRKKKAEDSEDIIKSLAIEASENGIDWGNVAPEYYIDWLETFAQAHSVVKELMFFSILPQIAGLLGAKTRIKLSEGHHEGMAALFYVWLLAMLPSPRLTTMEGNFHWHSSSTRTM